ncbi:MAG TPA: NADAR family protein [Cellvibrionaceae bacterium]
MLFPSIKDDDIAFSMQDPSDDWSRLSAHPFELEGVEWPTVEHYYQAMKFDDANYREKIRGSDVGAAIKLGDRWFKKKRSDWKSIEKVVMTRALYIKCRTYPIIAERLLATGDKTLLENSQYDYHWGCGRDRRGGNLYGKVLMNVREKLREELDQKAE